MSSVLIRLCEILQPWVRANSGTSDRYPDILNVSLEYQPHFENLALFISRRGKGIEMYVVADRLDEAGWTGWTISTCGFKVIERITERMGRGSPFPAALSSEEYDDIMQAQDAMDSLNNAINKT